ncbi:TetR/AcrR family transcriptional regulator [Clostridium sp. BL-8]|uniref:TetR/AcrR family transcriptional regulator n=1 Tax=Clostridium sp. BL-8 TaxID=349938 RepID=UPI00098BEE76|nr:TetR/AcrR family transcriptional regulator [Clostridium sp. BL-8]OOM68610.1 biofilm operon icaADBC HTH-type negative transcriptional regulator IcaR [Clostridium sp. BL-8]
MNKTKTRELIFQSAIKVFSESGYRGATMDEIAANADLVKGTLYYHFKSKEEIFNFIVEEGLRILHDQVTKVQVMNIGPVEKLINICGIQLTFLYGYTSFFKVVMSQLWGTEDRQNQLRNKIKKYIDEIEVNIKGAMELGLMKKGDTELLAFQFFGSLCSSAIYESIHNEKIDLENIIDSTIKFTLSGLGISFNER